MTMQIAQVMQACFEADCSDGADNDGDGTIDCDDSDCVDSADCVGQVESDCADGLDDDGDGDIDCDDSDCAGSSDCIVQGAENCCRWFRQWNGTVDCDDSRLRAELLLYDWEVHAVECDCTDGIDNDGNGQTDCDDQLCTFLDPACTGGGSGTPNKTVRMAQMMMEMVPLTVMIPIALLMRLVLLWVQKSAMMTR